MMATKPASGRMLPNASGRYSSSCMPTSPGGIRPSAMSLNMSPRNTPTSTISRTSATARKVHNHSLNMYRWRMLNGGSLPSADTWAARHPLSFLIVRRYE